LDTTPAVVIRPIEMLFAAADIRRSWVVTVTPQNAATASLTSTWVVWLLLATTPIGTKSSGPLADYLNIGAPARIMPLITSPHHW
jgi:hypothetical protein